MKKQLGSIVAICVLAVMLSACGASKPADTEKASAEEIITEPEENTKEQEPVQEEAVSVDPDYQITRDVYGETLEKRLSMEYNFSDFELDSRGNIVSVSISGSNHHTLHNEYDENNRLIKSIKETKLYGTEEHTWSYDENGHMTEYKVIETDKDGKKTEWGNLYYYDDAGIWTGGSRSVTDGTVFDITAEHDELGRITGYTETQNGTFEYAYSFDYEEGVYNPVHRVEDSPRSHYEIDVSYDDYGRLIKEDVVNKDGEKYEDIFRYEVIGEITESPSVNPALLPGDGWVYFDDCPNLPKPDSCLATVIAGSQDKTFILPTYMGTYITAMGHPYYEPYMLESSFAMTALDQYINILTDVLELEVQRMGTIIKVSKDGTEIAVMNLDIVDGTYVLTVNPA